MPCALPAVRPDRLVVAPIDLRIADPHIAEEIYAGRFAMGGSLVDTDGGSPFQVEGASGPSCAACMVSAGSGICAQPITIWPLPMQGRWSTTGSRSRGARLGGHAYEPDVLAATG
jgi:hypothetical protein